MKTKLSYRVRNWKDYNRSLVNRGNITLLIRMLGLGAEEEIRAPRHSRLSRRGKALNVQVQSGKRTSDEKLDLVVDSTGLKIYGEGEWKTRIHGKQKRRTRRKYHVAVDPDSHEVVAMELTEANVHDSTVMTSLMAGLNDVGNVYADGAYPLKHSLDAIAQAGGQAVIPPRSGTCIVKDDPHSEVVK